MKRKLAKGAFILSMAGLLAICAVAARPLLLPHAASEPSAASQPAGMPPAAAVGMPHYLASAPMARVRGILEPWRVGIQAGHWKISELPDEQHRLRGDTGAQWKGLTEVAVNLEIAARVQKQLQSAGVTVDLLPATVPAGYDADAFVAIHADDGGGTNESGWKIASPWRSSVASRKLRDAIALSYGSASGLPEDRYGVSYNMLGYYAFAWTRYGHAVAPTTPSAIIETGFLTSPTDRQLIVDDPERAARGISMGILAFLGELSRLPLEALAPISYPPMEVAADNAALYYFPDSSERIRGRLPAGTRVRIMDEANGWAQLVVWGNFRLFGWMSNSSLKPLEAGSEVMGYAPGRRLTATPLF
ncbi:MAG: N-acetylmuramoyl-L-alanine amidase [Spirochaetia bacterium]|jgi:N-acetylmuramoyl-L-alanine amidase